MEADQEKALKEAEEKKKNLSKIARIKCRLYYNSQMVKRKKPFIKSLTHLLVN